MTRLLLLLLPILLLACSITSLPLQAAVRIPPVATATLRETTQTANPTQTLSGPIFGCWNVRNAPAVGALPLRVQCGGTVQYQLSDNGFIEIMDGYVCGRAIGLEVKCQ
jgi:hypothetical protein